MPRDDDDEDDHHQQPPQSRKRSTKHHLVGFVHPDNGQMYLRNDDGLIFHSQRDLRGELVAVGRWDGANNKAVMAFSFAPVLKAPVTAAAHDDDDEEDHLPQPLSKRQRKELAMAQLVTRKLPSQLNFSVTDVMDHCETGIKAFRDLKFILQAFARILNRSPTETLSLYDPYFCTGRVKEHLARLGFPNVYNENEDFYAKINDQAVPPHDLLITNPPYSEDHMPRILEYCASQPEPFLLLLPSYVVFKDYYLAYLASPGCKPIFCVPKSGRYSYNSPSDESQNLRAQRIAPFASFWYIDCKQHRGALLEELSKHRAAMVHQGITDAEDGLVCSNVQAIPLRVLDENDPRKIKAKTVEGSGRRTDFRRGGGRGGRGRGGAKKKI
jgi:hypothetical protein